MLRVYRFEHKYLGCGPLCGKTDFRWDLYFKHHACPCDDAGFPDFERSVKDRDSISERDHPGFFFGASNLDWLLILLRDGAEEELEFFDFELMEYEVTEDFYILDDGQVYFNKRKAKRVDKKLNTR